MKRRLAALTASMLAAVGVSVAVVSDVAAAPLSAAENPSIGVVADVSPQIVAALQRDLGLSEDQVRSRLVREDVAAQTEAILRERLGGSFAGAWLIGNADTLDAPMSRILVKRSLAG